MTPNQIIDLAPSDEKETVKSLIKMQQLNNKELHTLLKQNPSQEKLHEFLTTEKPNINAYF